MTRFTLVLLTLVVFISLAGAQMTKPSTVNLSISGMTCEGCVSKVDKALRSIEGVQDVKVDLKGSSAEVVLASASVKSDVLVKAVTKAGFKAKVGAKAAVSKKADSEKCCPEGEMKEGGCSGECEKEAKPAKKTGKS